MRIYLFLGAAKVVVLLFCRWEFLMQRRQQSHEVPNKKLIDLVKRLEEALFKSARTTVCCIFFFFNDIAFVLLYIFSVSYSERKKKELLL